MIGLIILLIYNANLFSKALGSGLARRRTLRKKKYRTISHIIAIIMWTLAATILLSRPGGLFGNHPIRLDSNHTIGEAVSGNTTIPPSHVIQGAAQVGTLFQSSWFYASFLGLLAVASVILARSILISWQEGRAPLPGETPVFDPEAIASVKQAFQILATQPDADPRTRIINSYQRMVQAAYRLGAPLSSGQTARELEVAIRSMLGIRGHSLRELTDLFEEARYSLHPIIEKDAENAQQYLQEIAQEMNITLSL